MHPKKIRASHLADQPASLESDPEMSLARLKPETAEWPVVVKTKSCALLMRLTVLITAIGRMGKRQPMRAKILHSLALDRPFASLEIELRLAHCGHLSAPLCRKNQSFISGPNG